MAGDNDELLTEREVARMLGWSPRTLQRRRWQGDPPAYVKIGSSVRYWRSTVDRLITAGERGSTSDAEPRP